MLEYFDSEFAVKAISESGVMQRLFRCVKVTSPSDTAFVEQTCF